MSRRRRIRRQNRVDELTTPATRTARSVLVDLSPRGLRSVFGPSRREQIRPTRPVQVPVPAERMRRINMARRDIKRANQLAVQDKNNIGLISVAEPAKIQVDLPRQHPVCVQRRERRELLFAKGKAGKGGQKPRKPGVIIRCD